MGGVVPVAAFEPSGIHHGGQVARAQVVGPEVQPARQFGRDCPVVQAAGSSITARRRSFAVAPQPLDGGLHIRRGAPLDLA